MATNTPTEDTLDDDAWKDSFDKLLDPRPILRELQVIKKNVRASFNIDSSVENCSSKDASVITSENNVVMPIIVTAPANRENLIVDKSEKLALTPQSTHPTLVPFKCSLSPIGDWRYQFFHQPKKSTIGNGQLHATPIPGKSKCVDYEKEDNALQCLKNPKQPTPLPRRSSKARTARSSQHQQQKQQRRVFFNALKNNVRASFNIDSSIENCVSKGSSVSDSKHNAVVPIIVAEPVESVNLIADQCEKLTLTPQLTHPPTLPFQCSISPVGDWRYQFFQQPKKTTIENGQLHATPIPGKSICYDYEKEDNALQCLKDPKQPSPLPRRSSKARTARSSQQQRRVFFEELINNSVQSANKSDELKELQSIIEVKTSDNQLQSEQYEEVKKPNLQPGKWRKSMNIWRRTQKVPTDNHKNYLHRISHADNSVEYISTTVGVGVRKSIFIKPERRTTKSSLLPLCPNTYNTGEWEKNVLERCKQIHPLPFAEVYGAEQMGYCRKIGEGAYGEVFLNRSQCRPYTETVFKVIPIEGQIEINGEVQKTFEQILPEIIITMELCNLRELSKNNNATSSFIEVKKVACVKGVYPKHLVKLWELYDEEKESENDHPHIFGVSQLYIVLELAFGGIDLESFIFNNAEQAYYALQQIIFTLAVGEEAFQFEHRDLHWGNVLILNTKKLQYNYKLHGKSMTLPTKGIRVTIIDYTLSRMTFDDCCLYNDLSNDEELFTATGDYQFEIYRMMRNLLKNNWESYEPKTNVYWISYLLEKLLNGAKYKSTRTKTHSIYMEKIGHLNDKIMEFKSANDCAYYLQTQS